MPAESDPETILMITLSAGGGHIQATRAKFKQIEEKDPKARFLICDLFIDTFGVRLGKFFLWTWNSAQERGNVGWQEWFRVTGFPIAQKIFSIPIFFRILYLLLTNPIKKIIDTQPMGTSAIIKAIRVVSFFSKRKIEFDKIITELPSDQVGLFFKPIKHLSKKEKPMVKVCCSFGTLLEKEEQNSFWEKQCGLLASDIKYDDPPLRPYFLKLRDKVKVLEDLSIKIFTHSKEEIQLIEDAAIKGSLKLDNQDPYLKLTIKAQDSVSIIMLGSRPHEKATLRYVRNFIDLAKLATSEKRHLVFVFCRNYDEKANSLLKQVHDLVCEEQNFPPHLVILPMPFQDDDVIAPLFFRSDMTLTRSGGITAMELLSVCHGDIWIHTEQLNSKAAGMPSWEEANARHLMKQKGAKFITPDSFYTSCENLFK
jgi:hypothetical protein